jgi:hypothetical protein
MKIDETVPGFCRCRSAYTPNKSRPYPYLPSARVEEAPTARGRRTCRILPPLPIPETFRNGLATARTPRVIRAGSDVRTDLALRHRNRQDGAGATARRSGFAKRGALSVG